MWRGRLTVTAHLEELNGCLPQLFASEGCSPFVTFCNYALGDAVCILTLILFGAGLCTPDTLGRFERIFLFAMDCVVYRILQSTCLLHGTQICSSITVSHTKHRHRDMQKLYYAVL